MTDKISIFPTKKIITMSHSCPVATHVAVKNDRIVGVGNFDELAALGEYELKDQFHDKIIMPGLVEGHSHALEGVFWQYVYAGYFDRTDPDRKLWPGLKNIDAVVERLQEALANIDEPDMPLIAWGFDPIYFKDRRMCCADLDKVSTSRPVLLIHASVHALNCNSLVLDRAGVTAETIVDGVLKDASGNPSGELREMAAMFMAFESAGVYIFDKFGEQSLWNFAKVAQHAGVTTATDLFNPLHNDGVQDLCTVTSHPAYPIRLVSAYHAPVTSPKLGIERIKTLQQSNTDKLYLNSIKLMTDGSIQGFTARLKFPGYHNGAPNGIWNAPLAELKKAVQDYHEAGLQLHIHTNGDEASEVMIGAIEAALRHMPRKDHRHTLQHCQMITEEQLQRAAIAGVCVNMFANHLYYWGEEHYEQTVGPERAERLEPFASAKRLGVKYAMHSDAPITPIDPLFTAWCAVNRQTARGRVLGEDERISVDDALHAITLGAAYTLKMDHLIGSIETGKFADFTVLEQDPYTVEDIQLKDISITATVLGGESFYVNGRG